MTTGPKLPYIDSDDFARRFSVRSQNLMWLLGAGASASAGVPTAADMIWDFKQQLFVSQRRAPRHEVADLSNRIVRNRLQSHVDTLGRLPPLGAPDEYAALFEAVYPAEADRRAYLDGKLTGGKPSYGHIALATLMKANRTRIVWTTNFDALVADACATVFGSTGNLTTADLDSSTPALQAIQEERWPVEVKLHGDFRSRRLKNTPDELRRQDSAMRQALVNASRQNGLVVVGYSGRDDSVMDSFDRAIAEPNSFPAGLFWLHRVDDSPLPRVADLLSRACDGGIEAALVSIDNFDEVMRDLLRLIRGVATTTLDTFAQERQVWSPVPIPGGRKGWPVIRLNALELKLTPSVCRLVACDIGGTAEVREAVRRAGVDVIAVRSQHGVLAFGADADIRTTFERFGIERFDIYALDQRRQRYDSTERGLLREALTSALERQGALAAVRRPHSDLLAPRDPMNTEWFRLREIVGTLTGTVTGLPQLRWSEGVGVRLDWANDRLWMLFEPRIVFDDHDDANRFAAAEFARERTAARYNRKLNEMLEFWSKHLSQDGAELRSMGTGDGIDAVFRLSSRTAGSMRVGA